MASPGRRGAPRCGCGSLPDGSFAVEGCTSSEFLFCSGRSEEKNEKKNRHQLKVAALASTLGSIVMSSAILFFVCILYVKNGLIATRVRTDRLDSSLQP